MPDAETQTSTEYWVLNDGFITPPDGASDEYMEEYGYDERDYDQMEDDFRCIQFDPRRAEPSFLTGIQVATESGQIFLNSQLVIDTTGGSDRRQGRSRPTSGSRLVWLRRRPGLSPTPSPCGAPCTRWRGRRASRRDVGLRFEPGWTFVLRVDFHTHYDLEEFQRLEQNGVIDRDAGTMTWFDRATLRAQWAAPAEVDTDLRWMTVGPATPGERDTFSVPPGPSSQDYAARAPDGDHTVFSAEIMMGKWGRAGTLRTAESCVANNSDFATKFVEHATYGAEDAPALGDLSLRCMWENRGDETVGWGPESEATVWGKKERCEALVFFYGR